MAERSTCFLLFLAMVWSVQGSLKPGNITCYECNRFRGSVLDTCAEDGQLKRIMKNCYACLKVHTRMEMHDYWNRPKVVIYNSFSCAVRPTYVKPEGCYLSTGSRSLTKVCYCYDYLCNSANLLRSNWVPLLLLFQLLVILAINQMWTLD
ncbi:uncharacterized protein LOC106874127 [Octopus bimaculoides]|uniref:Protein quiver n=1 Tax=Octopus bimaculoides TaxID=37653 RepID=A0A0L8GXT7_OCTBM|nr:uncharacterized protein LOC106874127 [Octopus bimaculoides]|eukprot:XP_014777228.1 PREDICTED: uncharacterized protein LOC106874127 [Octopus bimaculoides]